MTPASHGTTALGNRALISAVSNYVGQGFELALGFLLTPVVLHFLGRTDFGLWSLVGPVVAYGTLLDFGISSTVTKHVAEYEARGELSHAGAIVATALRLYLILAVVALLASAVAAPLITHILRLPPQTVTTARWVIFLAGASVAISIPCSITTAILVGLHRFDIVNTLSVSATLISLMVTVGVVALGGGVIGMAALTIPFRLVFQVPKVRLIRRYAPDLHLSWRGATVTSARQMASLTFPVFVIQVAGRLQSRTDELVVGSFRPVSDITPYALALRVGGLAQTLADQFVQILLPIASAVHAKDDRAQMRELYLMATRITLAIALPTAGILIALAGPVLGAWVGSSYRPYSYLVVFLGIALLLDTSTTPAGSVMQAMGRLRPIALASFFSGVTNLVLSIILVQRIGLVGVALGTLIPTAVESLGFMPIFVMRELDLRPRALLRGILFPVIVPAVPVLGFLVFVMHWFVSASFPVLAALSATMFALYEGLYVVVGASALEKQMYSGAIRGVMRYAFAHVR